MIKNINDILLFLKTTHEYRDINGITKKSLFFLIQEHHSLIQWNVDLDQTFDLCISFNLLYQKDNRVQITEKGLDVLEESDSDFDLNESQLRYLCENCFFNNNNFYKLFDVLKLFHLDRMQGIFVFNTDDYPIPQKLPVELLSQLNIISINENIWKLNRDYVHFLESYENQKSNLTQIQFEQILEEQKRIGSLAENLTMEYEKQRLTNKNLIDESQRITQISLSQANKGYDVKSFSKKTPSLKHNLFIEVKGRKHRLFSFIISSNELHVAKKLGSQYAIYFWNGLGSKNPPTSPTEIITDPYHKLKIRECKNCLQYIISLR